MILHIGPIRNPGIHSWDLLITENQSRSSDRAHPTGKNLSPLRSTMRRRSSLNKCYLLQQCFNLQLPIRHLPHCRLLRTICNSETSWGESWMCFRVPCRKLGYHSQLARYPPQCRPSQGGLFNQRGHIRAGQHGLAHPRHLQPPVKGTEKKYFVQAKGSGILLFTPHPKPSVGTSHNWT